MKREISKQDEESIKALATIDVAVLAVRDSKAQAVQNALIMGKQATAYRMIGSLHVWAFRKTEEQMRLLKDMAFEIGSKHSPMVVMDGKTVMMPMRHKALLQCYCASFAWRDPKRPYCQELEELDSGRRVLLHCRRAKWANVIEGAEDVSPIKDQFIKQCIDQGATSCPRYDESLYQDLGRVFWE